MKTVLVIGPESSGTRFLTEILSNHPLVLGSMNATKHKDVLDDLWYWIQKGKPEKALKCFPGNEKSVVLTRRSMPHALRPSRAAKFRDFADLDLFNEVIQECCTGLIMLITARNPVSNLASWTLSRHSAGKDPHRALAQYEECYVDIFRFIARTGTRFLVVPMESILLDPSDAYINCLFKTLDLPPGSDCEVNPNLSVNRKHFDWFLANGVKI